MQRYTEAVNSLYDEMAKSIENLDLENDEDQDMIYPTRLRVKRKNHLIALEVLNEILTPELKVFIRNLCNNTLEYPDEPIFYQAFGNNPKEGDKVLIEDIVKKGIDVKKIEELRDIWGLFGTDVGIEKIDGKEYYIINWMDSYEDNLIEKFETVSISSEIKNIIAEEKVLDEEALKRLKTLLRNIED